MSAYEKGFAWVYNRQWAGWARRIAPLVLDFYERSPVGATNRALLDLCCGTGQFAEEALTREYRVTGVDISEPMLRHARENTARWAETGRARFLQGDARNFRTDERFGLAVSTYDALNHLQNEAELRSCFRSVLPLVVDGGFYIFDLNTRRRLRRWTDISVVDDPEMMLINRALYAQEHDKAFVRITGFIRNEQGLYERFEETLSNTAFDLESVRRLLLEEGWKQVHLASVQDLASPLADPESEDRVWFVASR